MTHLDICCYYACSLNLRVTLSFLQEYPPVLFAEHKERNLRVEACPFKQMFPATLHYRFSDFTVKQIHIQLTTYQSY